MSICGLKWQGQCHYINNSSRGRGRFINSNVEDKQKIYEVRNRTGKQYDITFLPKTCRKTVVYSFLTIVV